jgi:spore maturation protein CgeB
MKMVIFGLTISSSWGNGHATLWRGLARALIERHWRFVFFERDAPYYRRARDLREISGGGLVLYRDWSEARRRAEQELRDADVAIVTSYCPDAIEAEETVTMSPVRRRVFYDLDTPVTLARLDAGDRPAYIGPHGLAAYDFALSYTGGAALDGLRDRLHAPRAATLYGHVDPVAHRPAPRRREFRGDLSYLGTYSPDRQDGVARFVLEPAQRRPERRFVIGGAQYPAEFPWASNIFFVRHLPPQDHAAFYCSSQLTLNVTRRTMAAMGWCPSGRLFEAAACGSPIVSDDWPGLEEFFEPGSEIIVAHDSNDVLEALDLPPQQTAAMAARARERVLAEHTSERRAAQLEELLGE